MNLTLFNTLQLDTNLLLASFMMGLFGSLHCIGMCGGIAGALSMAIQSKPRKKISLISGYHLGRLSSYTLLGLLFSLLWQPAFESTATIGLISRTIAGLLIIAVGFYIGRWWFGITAIERIGATFWKKLQPTIKKLLPVNTTVKAVSLGFLWGWLPCGLVYSALSLAMASGNAKQGAIGMLCFGLGTLPAVMGISFVFKELQTVLQSVLIRTIAASIFFFIGTWTIVSSWLTFS